VECSGRCGVHLDALFDGSALALACAWRWQDAVQTAALRFSGNVEMVMRLGRTFIWRKK